MLKKDLIKQLKKMKPENIELEICFSDGDVKYQNFNIFESDESILIQTREITL